ncbi:ankyrin [Aspergillus welwitschiae]|uniref:Ankyrin n=1 Tax=Aspergillus welwitschiae TaxID=1341132 RepID=A0A3F3QBQ9_9EURO|nr:ankyrin [Aspergillus welwitschiae]RDH36212.1 ankyrin [Aspergillus welwitschiae]
MSLTLESQIPQSLEADIANDKLSAVRELYESTDPDGQPRLLYQIAALAAKHIQLDIIDWVFTEGFQLPLETLNDEFYFQVCAAGSLELWKRVVKNGFNLNGHRTYEGNIDIVRFLLENGQYPNDSWAGYDDMEPSVAALAGERPLLMILHLLLQHGWNQKGSVAHIAAAEMGIMEALKLLVEHGADLEEAHWWWFNCGVYGDVWGTALYRAAFKGQRDSVAYLLDKGASTKFRDEKGRSIMWAARQGGNREVISLLLDNGLEGKLGFGA